jgi:hypothetical protein
MTPNPIQPIPLSDTDSAPAPLAEDNRPHMPEPLPVWLVTVADAHLPAASGLERDLDAFYVDLLSFERDVDDSVLVYHAENFAIIFDVREPPIERDSMRPVGIEILFFSQVENKLIEAEIEYTRQKSLNPGLEGLLVQDPAGNWIELMALQELR